MFARFVEHGLALPTSKFFKGMLRYYGIEYLNLNPNSSTSPSLSTSAKRLWVSSPTGFCSQVLLVEAATKHQ
jgi:hypothetical protein